VSDNDIFYLDPDESIKNLLRQALKVGTKDHPDGGFIHRFQWTEKTLQTATEAILYGES